MADRVRWTGRDWLTMLASALVVVLIGGAIGIATGLFSSSSASAAVTLVPSTSAGSDPFTTSVQAIPAVDFPPKVAAITATTRRSFATDPDSHTLIAVGSTPGLYGGSGDTHVCDAQKLISFLAQHSAQSASWATVLGIAPAGVAAYVGTLTPVVLTDDTLVTNHEYRDGAATAQPSVLQAGTAVMVDTQGIPRVKCNSGDPLTPPEVVNPTSYTGTPWPGYAPTQVTVVHPGKKVVQLTVVNITTGVPYSQPVGTVPPANGTTTTLPPAGDSGKFVAAVNVSASTGGTLVYTSSDGTAWTLAHGLPTGAISGLAWGHGKWIAVDATERGPTTLYESDDLTSWKPITTVKDHLAAIAYGDGKWTAVGWVIDPAAQGTIDEELAPGTAYTSADGATWTPASLPSTIGALASVAYSDGKWIAVDESLHQGDVPSHTYASSDGTTWTQQADTSLASWVSVGRIAFGAGQWALGGLDLSQQSGLEGGIVALSPDAAGWTFPPRARFAGDPVSGIAYGNGEWLVAGQTGAVSASPDGQTWTPRSHLAASPVLAFGGGTSDASTSTTTAPLTTTTPSTEPVTATTTAATASVRSIDWKNYTYKDLACGTNQPLKLTNGTYSHTFFVGSTCSMTITAIGYGDVTGDGVDDAIVNIHSDGGGTELGMSDWTFVFSDGPVNHGFFSGASFPPYSGTLTTWFPYHVAGDFDCCPSDSEKDTYTYSTSAGAFVKGAPVFGPLSDIPKRVSP